MKATNLAAFIFLAAIVSSTAAETPAGKTRAIQGWGDFYDRDGDCNVLEENGVVTLVVPGTHHDLTYTEEYKKRNAPRIVQPVEGDFTVQVEVAEFAPPGNLTSSGGDFSFASSGLLVWQDDKNFCRLERAATQTPFVWLERFEDGKPVVQQLRPLKKLDTGLKVERKGNQFTFYFNDGGDGQSWEKFHSEQTELASKLKIGVAAVNTTVEEFSPDLTGFEVQQQK